VSPLSFDFFTYLIEAERNRQERGLDEIHIVFVPQAPSIEYGERLFTDSHESWRLHNMLITSCWLLPSCKNISACNSREDAEIIEKKLAAYIFPKKYTVAKPIAHHHTGWPIIAGHLGYNLQSLTASEQAKDYAQQWIEEHSDGKKTIALTLREATFTPKRNSDVSEWVKFARLLQENGYFPVILRDIETALDKAPAEFEGIATFPEGVFNLELRMAFYEQCYMSAFVSNGPSTPCYFGNTARYLYFVTGEWLHEEPTPFNRIGLGRGTTPPFANHYQRWLWFDQDADRFLKEVKNLDEFICEKEANGTYNDFLAPIQENREPMMTVVKRIFDWSQHESSNVEPEFRLALYCYRRAPKEEKVKFENILMRARIHLRLQEPHMAKAISKYVPDMPEPMEVIYSRFGQSLAAGGHFEEARELYLGAIKRGTTTPEIIFHLGIVEQSMERNEEAIERFKSLIDQDIPTSAIYLQLGELYETLGQQDLALETYALGDAKGHSDPEYEKRRLAMQLANKFN
jgi:tetratricopeptide (TPR) repeat protein